MNEIQKIKFLASYRINETPKYRPLIDTKEEFDEIPQLVTKIDGQENISKDGNNGKNLWEVESNSTGNSSNMGVSAKTPVPQFDKTNNLPSEPTDTNLSDQPENYVDTASMEQNKQVDVIQNEIIKHNIKTMKSIHDRLEGLETMVRGLNVKLDQLNSDVKEVREPTNSEKLMNKKDISYPYYFNLNDLWSNNWFNEKYRQDDNPGIRELPDGTFIAGFDGLPQYSKMDIENSFNEINESTNANGLKKKTQGCNKKRVRLDESILSQERRIEIIKDFIKYAAKYLNLGNDIPLIKLLTNGKVAQKLHSFGGYISPNEEIKVVIANRNLADILRTLGHELVHHKQFLDKKITENSGNTGSPEENEANMIAGILLRNYGKINSDIFE